MRLFSSTPLRSFVVYPVVALLWEVGTKGNQFDPNLWYLPLMVWGYLQYRLCGRYRFKRGAGGPGLEPPPERLVATGPYALTRNPMYLGHIIFLIGLSLTLQSWFAALLTIVVAIWFHRRVLDDEKRLVQTLGQPYMDYLASVKRWVPGVL